MTFFIFIYTISHAKRREFISAYGVYGSWDSYFHNNAKGYMGLSLGYGPCGHWIVTEAWDSAEARERFTTNNAEYQEMCERYSSLWLTEAAGVVEVGGSDDK